MLGVRLTERAVGLTVRPAPRGRGLRAVRASDALGLAPRGCAGGARGGGGAAAHAAHQRCNDRGRQHLVPQLIEAFRERRPDLEISLDVGDGEVVFQRAFDRTVDVAVTGRIPDHERLAEVDFADNEFVFITAAGDPLAGRPRWVAMEELAGRPVSCSASPARARATSARSSWVSGQIQLSGRCSLGLNGAIKQARPAPLSESRFSRAACSGVRARARACPTRSAPRGGLPERRYARGSRSALAPVRQDVEAFMTFCTSRAARHAPAST